MLMNDSIEIIDTIKDNVDIKEQGLPVDIDKTSIEHPVNKKVNRVFNKNVNTNTKDINATNKNRNTKLSKAYQNTFKRILSRKINNVLYIGLNIKELKKDFHTNE